MTDFSSDYDTCSLYTNVWTRRKIKWFVWQVFCREMGVFHPILGNVRRKLSPYPTLYCSFTQCSQNPMIKFTNIDFSTLLLYRGGARNFPTGADSYDKGDKIWLSGYYRCQKSPKKSLSPSNGACLLRRGLKPLALP